MAAPLQSRKPMRARPTVIVWLVGAMLAALVPASVRAAEVAVRQTEGVTRGFLVLRTPAGEVLAEGDLLQMTKPEGVQSRLTFRFRDGSLFDETVVFSQQRVFRRSAAPPRRAPPRPP